MSQSLPFITVGIPVYNGARFLERAINSLCQQDYPNFEIVISDNCSTDATPEIALRLASQDSRIRYHVNDKNIGAVRNFVRVFELARGEYFMWAAYDDQWDPRCLNLLATELSSHPEAGLAHSGLALISESGELLSESAFPSDDNPNYWSSTELALRCVSPARGRPKLNFAMYGLFRSAVLRQAIGYVKDTAMWDRLFVVLMALIAPFRYCQEILYHRTLQETRANERYIDDNYAKLVRVGEWWRARITWELSIMLFACPAIPWTRKMVLPRVIFRFARYQFLHVVVKKVRKKNR